MLEDLQVGGGRMHTHVQYSLVWAKSTQKGETVKNPTESGKNLVDDDNLEKRHGYILRYL